MTAREAAREEWKKLKNKPVKEKLIHIGTYYWPHILVSALLLAITISLIISAAGSKEPAFQAYLMNSTQNMESQDNSEAVFAEFAGIDLNTHSVAISGSTDMAMADSQIIASQTASQALDVLCGDVKNLLNYAYSDYFCDLREILTPQQLQKWEPYLLYMDQKVYDVINEGSQSAYSLPDPADPKQMEIPIPVALAIPETSKLWNEYTFTGEQAAAGVIINSERPENAVLFLEFIMQ